LHTLRRHEGSPYQPSGTVGMTVTLNIYMFFRRIEPTLGLPRQQSDCIHESFVLSSVFFEFHMVSLIFIDFFEVHCFSLIFIYFLLFSCGFFGVHWVSLTSHSVVMFIDVCRCSSCFFDTYRCCFPIYSFAVMLCYPTCTCYVHWVYSMFSYFHADFLRCHCFMSFCVLCVSLNSCVFFISFIRCSCILFDAHVCSFIFIDFIQCSVTFFECAPFHFELG